MTEDWDALTQAEKIEDLRKDVTRILRILTELRAAAETDIVGLKAQVEIMKPWGPLLNRLMHRLNRLDGET